MMSIELNDVSMHCYSLCIGGLDVEQYPPTVQTRFQFTANAMSKSCEFNLREQSSFHRKLPPYGKDEVIYIKAPNRNITKERMLKAKFALLVLILFISSNYPCAIIYSMCIGGLVVEQYPATVQTWVRFPANAMSTKHFEYYIHRVYETTFAIITVNYVQTMNRGILLFLLQCKFIYFSRQFLYTNISAV